MYQNMVYYKTKPLLLYNRLPTFFEHVVCLQILFIPKQCFGYGSGLFFLPVFMRPTDPDPNPQIWTTNSF
jgi:hypothetical protein